MKGKGKCVLISERLELLINVGRDLHILAAEVQLINSVAPLVLP